jgi:hypothetical protein
LEKDGGTSWLGEKKRNFCSFPLKKKTWWERWYAGEDGTLGKMARWERADIQQSQALANRECEVGKFQKAVTPKVFEVRSPYQKTMISYPWVL